MTIAAAESTLDLASRSTSRSRWLARLLAIATLLVAFVAMPRSAEAQRPDNWILLGLTSLDGDDEFAAALSGAIRGALARRPGLPLSDADAVLTQIELASGCEAPELPCLERMANVVGARHVLFGYVHRDAQGPRFNFAISVSHYDASTGTIERTFDIVVPSNHSDIDELREPARAIAEDLAGRAGSSTVTGRLRVVGEPNAGVRIDGQEVGRTDATGGYVGLVPLGVHTVEVGSSAPQSIGVEAEGEAIVTIDVPESSSRAGANDALRWTSYGLLGVAGVSLVASTIFGILTLDQQAQLDAYRGATCTGPVVNGECTGMWRSTAGTNATFAVGSSVCEAVSRANSGPDARIREACRSDNEVSFWTFAVLTAVTGVAGASLLAIAGGDSSSEQAPVAILVPSISPYGASLTALGSF